ncbi:response regulator [Arcobacter sp. HD9-500m-PIT-SAG03]|nr:response regulator [Arcobacter sp. HD9-500m-PIT-SAG03]
MKILLLEDNERLNKTISLKLNLKGYEVHSFTDGREAFDNISEGYSCFVLDINVPKVNGIKILQEIRRHYKDVPVIIISATTELEYIKKSYSFGCNDYIKKPFFVDELEIKIDKLCNVHKDVIRLDEDIYFDFSQSILTVSDKEKKLTLKENLLLNLLLKHKNDLVGYEIIEYHVWEGEPVSIEAIRMLVARLKKNLEKKFIKSYSNRGYAFKELE